MSLDFFLWELLQTGVLLFTYLSVRKGSRRQRIGIEACWQTFAERTDDLNGRVEDVTAKVNNLSASGCISPQDYGKLVRQVSRMSTEVNFLVAEWYGLKARIKKQEDAASASSL